MDEIVFRPKYERRYRWSAVGVAIMVVLGVPLSLSSGDPWLWAAFAVLAAMVLLVPFVYLREVRFGRHITLRRYFLPDLVYPYGDVRDVGLFGFRLRRRTVQWTLMENGADLARTVDGLVESGVISEDQLDGKLVSHEVSEGVSVIYGSVLGLAAAVAVVVFEWYPSSIPPRVFGGLIALVSLGVVYVAHRWWSRRRPPAV